MAFGGRNEPLIGEHGLDDDACTPRSGDIELVRLLGHQATDGREVEKHLRPRFESIEAPIGLRRAFNDAGIERQNTDCWKPMSLADFPVIEIMGRRDLDATGTKRRINMKIPNNQKLAPHQRQSQFLADQTGIPRVLRVDRHGDVPQHGFGSGGCHDKRIDRALWVDQRITDLPEFAVLFLAIDLKIGYRGHERRIPVDQPFAAIDQPLLMETHEGLHNRRAHGGVHREVARLVTFRVGEVPVRTGAQAPHLASDRRPALLLPGPHAVKERIAAKIMARLVLGL